jgi:hypothetical protein
MAQTLISHESNRRVEIAGYSWYEWTTSAMNSAKASP